MNFLRRNEATLKINNKFEEFQHFLFVDLLRNMFIIRT